MHTNYLDKIFSTISELKIERILFKINYNQKYQEFIKIHY